MSDGGVEKRTLTRRPSVTRMLSHDPKTFFAIHDYSITPRILGSMPRPTTAMKDTRKGRVLKIANGRTLFDCGSVHQLKFP